MLRTGLSERLLPNPGKNVPYLDAIRGLAVLFILIRHAWGISGEPNYVIFGHSISPFIMMMSSGVDLFFVLSGFLLAARFLRADAEGKPAPDYARYFKARVLRIGPPYWVVLGLVLLLFTPTMIPNDRIWSAHGAFMALAHATFMQSMFIVSFGAYMVDAPFWTLTLEMVFYAILPYAVKAFYKFRWWQPVVASFAISWTWLYLCRFHLDGVVDLVRSHTFGLAYSEADVRFFLTQSVITYLPHFAIGCSAASILIHRPKNIFTSERAGILYLTIGVLLLAASMQILGRISYANNFTNPEHLLVDPSIDSIHYYFFSTSPFALAYGLIILGASLARQPIKDAISSIPGLTLLGVLGYSIYLIHMPIMFVLDKHAIISNITNPAIHFPALLVISIAVVLITSLGLFMAIERPAMVWSSSVSSRLSRNLRASPRS